MDVRKISNEEFTSFVKQFKIKSIYQTAEYSFIMSKQQTNTLFVGLFDDNKIIGASFIYIQNLDGFDYAYAPHGFLIDYENEKILKEFTNGIKKILKKMNVIAIKINPLIVKNIYNSKKELIYTNNNYDKTFKNLKKEGYYHLGYNNNFEALKPRFYAEIDLTQDIHDIFKNVKDEYKTKIRSANRNGITIYKGNEQTIKYMYEQTKNTYPRDLKYFEDAFHYFNQNNSIEYFYAKLDVNNFLNYQQQYYQDLQTKTDKYNQEFIRKNKITSNKALTKKIYIENQFNIAHNNLIDATNIISMYPTGLVIAAVLTVKCEDTVFFLIDGYKQEYKRFNAKHLLIWQLIEKYKKEGFKKLNIGGLPNITQKNEFEGLVQFKLNFGSKVYEYAGDFELITNNSLYFLYRNASPLRKLLKQK